MNIYEIQEKTQISLKILKKLDKLGVLKLDRIASEQEKILFSLAKNKHLGATTLLKIIETPNLLNLIFQKDAGAGRRISTAIQALGDFTAGGSTKQIRASIHGAARGNSDDVDFLVTWLAATLPFHSVPHVWIAVRLLHDMPENVRIDTARKLFPAMLRVRAHPTFAPYWEKVGAQIVYRRPNLIDF